MTELLTPLEAAELAGVSLAGLRSLATRAARAGNPIIAPRDQWPDQRSARYDRDALLRWRAATPRRVHAG